MRGQQQLIDLRMDRRKPALVFVETDPEAFESPVRSTFPEVLVEPTDSLQRLDLRCLVGLNVVVTGRDSQRVEAVVKACTEVDARVIGFAYDTSGHGDSLRVDVTRVWD